MYFCINEKAISYYLSILMAKKKNEMREQYTIKQYVGASPRYCFFITKIAGKI